MHYVIDGHNLIGQMPGIELSDPDDEAKLVEVLYRWILRHPQHRITVVFDRGSYGHPGSLRRERITPIFAFSPQDADTRLIHILQRMASCADVRVVTNDRRIATAARQLGGDVVAAQQFAVELRAMPRHGRKHGAAKPQREPRLSAAEVEEWLALFGDNAGPAR
ncbi:MAG: NYN domain-containing protein [Herpetosiphon sp.]